MIKFFKKHKLKIVTSFFCAFALSLFTIISFGCKTYAYTIDSNGNLVGDNLFNINGNWGIEGTQTSYQLYDNYVIVINNNQGNPWTNVFQNISVVPNQTYTLSYFQSYRAYCYILNNTDNTQIYGDGQTIQLEQKITFTTPNNCNSIKIKFYDQEHIGNSISYIMLNLGNEALAWEPYGIWYSQSNYNEIVNDYDILENQYNSMLSNVEIFNDNVSSQSLYFNNSLVSFTDWNYVFVAEKRRLTINTSGLRDIYDGIGANTNVRYELRLDNSVSALTCYGYVGTRYDIVFTIYNSDNTIIFSNSYNSTSGNLADGNFNFGNLVDIKKIIIETTIEDNDYGRDNSFIDFGSDYASGYADGVKDNNTYWRGIAEDYDIKINKLNKDINSLNSVIDSNNNTINTLKNINSDLQESLNNNVGWQSLFFAMADTPIRTVSNVLGFELFGLNLFSTFIGMVTVFAIVFLLKKFI